MKFFVRAFLCLLGATLFLSYALSVADIPLTGNDIMRVYQTEKLARATDIDTVMVGDSSLGNAVDAELFSNLTTTRSLNLALTGSFGLAGSFNMIRHARSELPHLRNVIIIHSPTIWNAEFSRQGYMETARGLSTFEVASLFPWKDRIELFLQLQVNPREIVQFARYVAEERGYLASGRSAYAIENDYFKQQDARFSNGMRSIDSEKSIPADIHSDYVAMLHSIGKYCGTYSLNCIYVHGPLHRALAENSTGEFAAMAEVLHDVEHLVAVTSVFAYENAMMGDTVNHIDPAYKEMVTEDYARAIRPFLFYE